MTKSKNRKAIIVGIFIVVGLGIFLVGVLALGGQNKLFTSTIAVKTAFTNINGLETGNNAWFEGVKIGTVKSISFSSDSRVIIQMSIEKKSARYIHNNASAKISSDGLMGNRIVVIAGGAPPSPTVTNGDTLAAETSLTTVEITNTLQKNNLNLLAITENLKEITSSIAHGEGSVGGLIKDKSLLNNLQSAVTLIKEAASNTKRASADIADYSNKLQSKGSFTNDLVSDTLIFSKLRSSISQIQEVSRTIGYVADNLNKTTSNLNDTTKFAGSLLQGEQMKENVNELLTSLHAASSKLNDDLEAVQHNFLFRAYFRKKTGSRQKPSQ